MFAQACSDCNSCAGTNKNASAPPEADNEVAEAIEGETSMVRVQKPGGAGYRYIVAYNDYSHVFSLDADAGAYHRRLNSSEQSYSWSDDGLNWNRGRLPVTPGLGVDVYWGDVWLATYGSTVLYIGLGHKDDTDAGAGSSWSVTLTRSRDAAQTWEDTLLLKPVGALGGRCPVAC